MVTQVCNVSICRKTTRTQRTAKGDGFASERIQLRIIRRISVFVGKSFKLRFDFINHGIIVFN